MFCDYRNPFDVQTVGFSYSVERQEGLIVFQLNNVHYRYDSDNIISSECSLCSLCSHYLNGEGQLKVLKGKWKGKVQTSERKIEFQNPTQNTYNIVIGVSAPKDVTSGQFNLKLKLKS